MINPFTTDVHHRGHSYFVADGKVSTNLFEIKTPTCSKYYPLQLPSEQCCGIPPFTYWFPRSTSRVSRFLEKNRGALKNWKIDKIFSGNIALSIRYPTIKTGRGFECHLCDQVSHNGKSAKMFKAASRYTEDRYRQNFFCILLAKTASISRIQITLRKYVIYLLFFRFNRKTRNPRNDRYLQHLLKTWETATSFVLRTTFFREIVGNSVAHRSRYILWRKNSRNSRNPRKPRAKLSQVLRQVEAWNFGNFLVGPI